MQTNKLIIPTAAITLLLIITIGGCITDTAELTDNKTNKEYNINYTENDTKNNSNDPIAPELNTNLGEFETNTKISFKTGELYNYKTTTTNQTGEINTFPLLNTFQINDSNATTIKITYNITEIGKVDEKDVYVVARNDTQNPELKINYYYDKETGELLKLKEIVPNKRINLKGDRAFLESMKLGAIMFEDWMLALSDDFNYKRTVDLGQEGAGLIINYEVVDTEKIGNRECYKVEQKMTTEAIYEQMNRDIAQVPDEQVLKSTIWVDKT
ncbi:MAG: hypothetical protein CVT89_05725, partial [Candidatus Altiarchaeales archaeon HGW-Altiarchaeales-2]